MINIQKTVNLINFKLFRNLTKHTLYKKLDKYLMITEGILNNNFPSYNWQCDFDIETNSIYIFNRAAMPSDDDKVKILGSTDFLAYRERVIEKAVAILEDNDLPLNQSVEETQRLEQVLENTLKARE